MKQDNAKWVGKVLLHFDELPSTNDYARYITRQSEVESGTVIRTDCQTAGRGQLGAVWESAPSKNLTLTIILHPVWLRAEAQVGLSQAVALAIAASIKSFVPDLDVGIKWPNDLLVQQRKVGGILIENTISGQFLAQSLIGIGVNVNQVHFSSALPNAASLSSLAGRQIDLDAFQAHLFASVEYYYEWLRLEGGEGIHQAYLRNLFGMGVRKRFLSMPGEEPFWGCIRGVDPDGRLCIETDLGLQKFALKEIKQFLESD